jgi:peptide-methionine (S)-S-oxide reductase
MLAVFFTSHDPSTPYREGADVGTQYRSAIFFESPEQERAAREAIRDLEAGAVWAEPIVTQVAPLDRFHPAEAHHQEYFARNPSQPYCQVVVAPKVAKLRKEFMDRLRDR